MDCSQPTAWTPKRSLLMASRVKACPVSANNSSSTLPTAAHVEGGVIGCDKFLHLVLGKWSGISQHAANPFWLCTTCLPTTTSNPETTTLTIPIANHTHAPTVTVPPTTPHAALALLRVILRCLRW